MRTYITQDSNGNITTSYIEEEADHTQTPEQKLLSDSLFEDILQMTKKYNLYTTNISQSIVDKDISKFKELAEQYEKSLTADCSQEYSIIKSRIELFFTFIDSSNFDKNINTAIKYFTNDKFLKKELILLSLWLKVKDEAAYSMMEKNSYNISDKTYDNFFSLFEKDTNTSAYSHLWLDGKTAFMEERKQHFLSIQRNLSSFTKLSKDISKMENNIVKRKKI